MVSIMGRKPFEAPGLIPLRLRCEKQITWENRIRFVPLAWDKRRYGICTQVNFYFATMKRV